MGLFDSFIADKIDECPIGHPLSDGYSQFTEYQTKSLDCMMESYHIGDKVYQHGKRISDERVWVYEWCGPCNKMVGRWAKIEDDTFVGFEGEVQFEGSGSSDG